MIGYLVIHYPMKNLYESRSNIVEVMVLIFIVIYALFFSFLLIYFYRVHKPLKEILKGALEFANGNLTYTIPVDSEDEMGYLSHSLNYMADKLNKNGEYQRQFISNVSHDFRSPLTSIKGYVEAMLDGTIPPEMQERYLKVIAFESTRLEKLTRSLLTLNELDVKKRMMHMRRFDINETIRTTAATFEGICTERNIRLELFLAGKELFVRADMEQIQQVLYNLLDNAVKFSSDNSSITLETTVNHGKVFVSVKDHGTGIPKESLSRIWDRFYKIDMHHTGSGIGLALVKAFVEMHGGTISVESDEKQGTVFTVELPVQSCEAVAAEPDTTLVSADSRTTDVLLAEEEELEKGYDSSKSSVLIIDDNEDIRSYVHTLLHTDYTVIEAADGSEGIRKAMKYVPDLIISDVMMPGIDGIECCRRLKSELQTCHIPVILLTACSLDEQRIQGYDGGADSYISKPFSSQLLLARVRNLIDSHRRLKQFFW